MAIFRLEPSSPSGHFGEVVTFLSHVAMCYKEALKDFPSEISALLSEHYLTLDRELRKVMVRALILMRNRGLCEPVPLLKLCFLLFRCPDKELRQLLFKFIVSDVRNMNKNSLNHRVNNDLQNFLYTMLEDASTVAARKSLDVIIELYRRRIWTGARTVNAVAGVCLSKQTGLARAAVRFFLGIDHLIDADQDEEDDESRELVAHAKMLSERTGSVSKKTRARKRRKAREITKAKKIQQKMTAEDRRLDDVRWPAIDLLHDAQGFVDKLYKRVRTSHAQFEVRMLFMNLLSRVIGRNQCLCLNYYQFMTRYMQPSQRDVTKMMAYVVQACHELVPPDELKPLIKTLANNFVTDRCSGEVIAVGLNTLREVAARVPLVLDEEDLEHIWLDMVDYRTYRGDKNVAVAARSALNFFRDVRPELLKRKDRGKEGSMALSRGTAGVSTNRQYGEIEVAEGVDGVELLEAHKRAEALSVAAGDAKGSDVKDGEDGEDGDEGWEVCSDDEEDGASEGNWVTVEHSDDDDDEVESSSAVVAAVSESAAAGTIKRDQRDRLDANKILTPRDFELLEQLKAERSQLGKRKRRAADHYAADAMLRTDNLARASVVDPLTLEGPHAIRKRGLEERLRTMREGQMGRDSNVAGRKAGMSNREKEKRTKNFMMISKKRSVIMKQKESLRQVRAKVNKHRAHLKKNTKTITKIRSRRRQGR
jgi:protein SDA1